VHSGPYRGDLKSSSFVSESRLGGFLHAHPCELAPRRPCFPARNYSRNTLETTWSRFDLEGGGGISLCLILWRGACPSWLSLPNGDSGSTQILTQDCGAKSQTISQLTNLGPRPRGKYLLFSPSGSSKHLQKGSTHKPQCILTTQMESWGFIKSSVQNKVVHMEPSLCVSFQLRRSLGGYTVGTTVGFHVETVEALAPRSHHRILRGHP
jgi:hypothetical protein